MKSRVAAGFLLLVVVSCLMIVVRPWASPATAQGDRVIPVFIHDYRTGWSLTYEGAPCSLVGSIIGRSVQIPMHVVVRDESGIIIASAEPEGVATEGGFEDWYACNAIFDLPVPNAEFYVLYIGDRYVRTVSAADFPLDFGIAIDLENGS